MFVPCVQCPLRRKPLFRPFSDLELDFVAGMKTQHVVVPPRADIIREDEVGGPVYTLFEGWAVRYHRLPRGGRQVLDVVLPGDLIGLASAITGTVRHSVQALTPASLCVLQGKGFSELFERHPAMALSLLKTRIEEEQRADKRLSLMGRSTAEQRVGYFMLETFDRLRQRGVVDGGSTCPFPLQRRDLADAAGLSRVHVSRTLESLRRRRLAEIQDGVLVLFDRNSLADVTGYIPVRTSVGMRSLF